MKPFPVQARWRLASTSVLCLAIAVGFVALIGGLLGGPSRSSADPTGGAHIRLNRLTDTTRTSDKAAPNQLSKGRPLGELAGTSYRVQITTSPQGPRYTILSLDGSVLLDDATLDEAADAFPDLHLKSLKGGPDDAGIVGPLMLADPEK